MCENTWKKRKKIDRKDVNVFYFERFTEAGWGRGKKQEVPGAWRKGKQTVVYVCQQSRVSVRLGFFKDFMVTFMEVLSGLLNTKNDRKVELAADQAAAVHELC